MERAARDLAPTMPIDVVSATPRDGGRQGDGGTRDEGTRGRGGTCVIVLRVIFRFQRALRTRLFLNYSGIRSRLWKEREAASFQIRALYGTGAGAGLAKLREHASMPSLYRFWFDLPKMSRGTLRRVREGLELCYF